VFDGRRIILDPEVSKKALFQDSVMPKTVRYQAK
jgi:hypothetical protein